MKRVTTNDRRVCCVLLSAGVLGALGGCRGDREDQPPRQFFPDLDDQLKWSPQSGSEMFADGRMMRQPVAGTVPFGRVSHVGSEEWAQPFRAQREEFLREDPALYEGKNADGSYVERIPIQVDRALLLRGQERFNIYCAVCHGYQGDGKGMVGDQKFAWSWSVPVADLHAPLYKDPTQPKGRDGFLFWTSRYGVPPGAPEQPAKMPGYAHALNVRDSWAIVAYVRALQATREGTMQDVPEALRAGLLQTRETSSVPPTSPASTGGGQ